MRTLGRPAACFAVGLTAVSMVVAANAQSVQPAASQRLFDAVFETNAAAAPLAPTVGFGEDDAPSPLMERTPDWRAVQGLRFDRGALDWWSSEISQINDGGAVDRLRVAVASLRARPADAPTVAAYSVDLTRGWPRNFRAGGHGGEVSPYVGVGVDTAGASAMAGAQVAYGPGADADRLDRLGVQDGVRFGDKGRWYLFGAARGRAVGLNLSRDRQGALRNAGLSRDSTAVVGDAQVGVGWRKGPLQTSVSYLRRKFASSRSPASEELPRDEDVVAFSISIKPQR